LICNSREGAIIDLSHRDTGEMKRNETCKSAVILREEVAKLEHGLAALG